VTERSVTRHNDLTHRQRRAGRADHQELAIQPTTLPIYLRKPPGRVRIASIEHDGGAKRQGYNQIRLGIGFCTQVDVVLCIGDAGRR